MWDDTIRYAEVTSTNDVARDHACRGVPEGTAVVASYQAAGRGRQGRPWDAPAGKALLTSIILRPPGTLCRSAWLTLGAGIAVADATKMVTDLDVGLKWPNDVRHGGRKLAGVLTETYREDNGPVCIVGIGLNVNQEADDFPETIADTATSLRIVTGHEWPLDDLLDAVRTHLQLLYDRLKADDTETLRRRWCELDETLGRNVVVESPGGAYRGRASTIDEYGALWVEDVRGDPQRIVVGDVTIRLED